MPIINHFIHYKGKKQKPKPETKEERAHRILSAYKGQAWNRKLKVSLAPVGGKDDGEVPESEQGG